MDPVHFTGKEILEMAVKIEENGLRFYTDAGAAAKTKEMKELFRSLAAEEGEHIRVFRGFSSLLTEERPSGYDQYAEEAEQYLRAIANTEVFTSPTHGKELGSDVETEKEVLGYAINMEKDSLLFYYEMLKMVREEDRPVLDNLILQEKTHLRRLSALMNNMNG